MKAARGFEIAAAMVLAMGLAVALGSAGTPVVAQDKKPDDAKDAPLAKGVLALDRELQLSEEQKERIAVIRAGIRTQIRNLKALERKLVMAVLDEEQKQALGRGVIGGGAVQPGPGFIGRTTINGEDIGHVFRYEHGKLFEHSILEGSIFEPGEVRYGVCIVLQGRLRVPRQMTVRAWLAGGSPTRGVHTLFVNDKEIGSVGDDRTKNTVYELPLAKGTHSVKWVLTGGDFGRSLLEFRDPETNKRLPVYYSQKELKDIRGIPAKKVTPISADNHVLAIPSGS